MGAYVIIRHRLFSEVGTCFMLEKEINHGTCKDIKYKKITEYR